MQLLNVFAGRCPVRDLSTVINISLFHNMHQIRADSPHQGGGPALLYKRHNSETPKTATAILQGLPLPFSPSHPTNLSLPTALTPRATWGRFCRIQSPKYLVVEGSACSSNSGGGASPRPQPHVLKTNLFKTCLTSSHHPLATESDSIP